jgi:hypothetical protein
VPVIVNGYELDDAPLLTVIVSVELPAPEIDEGLNLPLTAFGSPLTLNLIGPVKPAPAVAVTV